MQRVGFVLAAVLGVCVVASPAMASGGGVCSDETGRQRLRCIGYCFVLNCDGNPPTGNGKRARFCRHIRKRFQANDPNGALPPCLPQVCQAETGTNGDWILCSADENGAWVSAVTDCTPSPPASDCSFDANQICQDLGYSGAHAFDGNNGSECGVESDTTCDAPGTEPTDEHSFLCSEQAPGTCSNLVGDVTWTCS